MIPARPHRLFARLFAHHARGRIRGAFHEVRAHGVVEARAAAAKAPLLVICNHTAWWDPLVALYLSHYVLQVEAFALMDAANLRRLPFFGRVGAFGVDLGDPADGARGIRYAARLLRAPATAVWLFPQGDERPITEPLMFRPGSAEIARLARGCRVLPVALRYEHGKTERPSLWISFGESAEPARDVVAARAAQEAAVTRELTRIDVALRTGDAVEFDTMHAARPSFFGMLAERLLARLTA